MLLLILGIACVVKGGDCGWYGCYGGYGCYPGCHGYWAGPVVYPGWYGYAGYPGYSSWAANYSGGVPSAAQPAPAPAAQPASARVVVKLPADARFFIGDRAWSLNSTTHSFKTPELRPDFRYEYTLRAEVERNGRTVSRSKQVTVLAGQETVVEFGEFPAAELARP